VNLYQKYQGRVNFVIVDLDLKRSPAQRELVNKYYRGYIPHVIILNKFGKPVYNSSGEVEEGKLSAILDELLK
jgi:thioredoxin-like negative regulator of GroEL